MSVPPSSPPPDSSMTESLYFSSPPHLTYLLRHLPLPWLFVSGREPMSGGAGVRLRPGSGTLSWVGQDRAEPRQHRAALMKGQAAGRPSGYADRGLIGLMRCSVASARSSTTGQRRTKQGGKGLLLGQRQEETFIMAWVWFVFLKLNIYEWYRQIMSIVHGLGIHRGCNCLDDQCWLGNKTFKPKIYHNNKKKKAFHCANFLIIWLKNLDFTAKLTFTSIISWKVCRCCP